jgi:hypothetical protein
MTIMPMIMTKTTIMTRLTMTTMMTMPCSTTRPCHWKNEENATQFFKRHDNVPLTKRKSFRSGLLAFVCYSAFFDLNFLGECHVSDPFTNHA